MNGYNDCAHKPKQKDEPLVRPYSDEFEALRATKVESLTHEGLIEEIASQGYAVYEMGDCPCRLNELRREALFRMTGRSGLRGKP